MSYNPETGRRSSKIEPKEAYAHTTRTRLLLLAVEAKEDYTRTYVHIEL